MVTAHTVHVEGDYPDRGSLEFLCQGLAEAIGRRDGGRAGRPFFIELAGTPRAGKTTALTDLAIMLRHNQLRVETVDESAAGCPIPHKRDPDYNLWTFFTTMAQIIWARHTDTDVVLIDRGIVDAVFWMDWYLVTGHLSVTEYHAIEKLALLQRWEGNLVLVLTIEPPIAIARDAVGRRAAPGRIVNPDTLGEFNAAVERVHQRFNGRLPLVRLDTTRLSKADVLRRLMEASIGAAAACRERDDAGPPRLAV